jgi:DNA-binding HxlR family transcriptional regulator/peroxiredoxin
MLPRDYDTQNCSVARTLEAVGDRWTMLVIREAFLRTRRFEDFQAHLGIARNVLSDRLNRLVDDGILERRPYQDSPPRFEYRLTDKGRGLLPVLIALQDWGTRYVAGDGSLTATTAPTSAEARRVQGLVGRRIPKAGLWSHEEGLVDPVAEGMWTVLYAFPGAFVPVGNPLPPDWADIPGATGCTLESTTYRDRHAEFERVGAAVHGLSTQRTDQLGAFAEHARLPFLLLSDEDLTLAAALRLPTFRASGVDRLKRLTMVVDPERTIRAVQFPVTDPVRTVEVALATVTELSTAGLSVH